MLKEREPEFARRKDVVEIAGDGRAAPELVLEEAEEAAAAEPPPDLSPVDAVERAAASAEAKRERRRQRRPARPHGRARQRPGRGRPAARARAGEGACGRAERPVARRRHRDGPRCGTARRHVPRAGPRHARGARRRTAQDRPTRAPAAAARGRPAAALPAGAVSRPLSRLLPRRRRREPHPFWAVFRPIVQPITLALAPAAAYGVERVPRGRGAVLAANHFSGIDHPLIGCFVPGTTYFLAKSELFEIPVIGDWLELMGVISIRRGESDRDALRRSREVVRNGHLVCV